MNTSFIRHGAGVVRPYVHGPMELLSLLQNVFEAKIVERHDFSPTCSHCELQIGDSTLVLEAGELPRDVKPWTCSLYVYVANVDAVFKRAKAHGVIVISEPTDKPYKERQAGFRDVAGNTWWIATYMG